MSIQIAQEGDLYTAEVTPPHGQWRSPYPMRAGELLVALRSIGCSQTDIDEAIREVTTLRTRRLWEEEITPTVHAALSGEYEVPAQPPRTEALLAYALFLGESPLALSAIVDTVDFTYRLVPTPDEIAWAFLRLRRREWLAQQGNLYGLTVEGRRAIEDIVGEGSALDRIERLKVWTLAHPPPGDR